MSNMNDKLEGFVISRKPLTELEIKRLLLIYDTLYFLNPKENRFFIPDKMCKIYNPGHPISEFWMAEILDMYNGRNYEKQTEKLFSDFDYAIAHGQIKILNLRDRKFYQKNWFPLLIAYNFDTGNEELLKTSFSGFEDIVPFHKGGDGALLRGFLQPADVHIFPDIPQVPDIFPDYKNDKTEKMTQAFSMIAHLDRGLAISGEYNLSPIFIDKTMQNLYIQKQKIIKSHKDKDLYERFRTLNGFSLDTIQYILYDISHVIIKDDVLSEIPIRELIIARDNTFHELLRLRRKIKKDIASMERECFDEKFQKDAEEYILRKIKPQIEFYNSKFVDTFVRFLSRLGTFAFASIGAGISCVQDLNPLQMCYLTGISAVAGESLSSRLTDYVVHEKGRARNSFGYFFNFKDFFL